MNVVLNSKVVILVPISPGNILFPDARKQSYGSYDPSTVRIFCCELISPRNPTEDALHDYLIFLHVFFFTYFGSSRILVKKKSLSYLPRPDVNSPISDFT